MVSDVLLLLEKDLVDNGLFEPQRKERVDEVVQVGFR